MKNSKNLRATGEHAAANARTDHFEVFRTPAYCFHWLFDYAPGWWIGPCIDPSAGDGRMVAALVDRGNDGPHTIIDIRPEEEGQWGLDPRLNACTKIVGDCLAVPLGGRWSCAVTNPPFTLAGPIVERLLPLVDGHIAILQSTAWIGTERRSRWLKERSGMVAMLNLAKRPKWETLAGGAAPNNVWDYAWYVFRRGHRDPPFIDWLFGAGPQQELFA